VTVLQPTAARPGEAGLSPLDPGFLRRCLLLAVPCALSVALVLATLNLSSAVRLRLMDGSSGPAPRVVPEAGAAAEVPSGPALSPAFTPEVRYWSQAILRWSQAFGLDPNLVAAVMQIESCGDPTAVSSAGARGLFQVMPYHFEAGEDPLDPETNARRGLRYLAQALERAGGQVGLALAGYNGGHGVIAWPPESWPTETRRYAGWGTGLLADVAAWPASGNGLSAWLAAGGSRLCVRAAAVLGLSG